MDGAPRQRIQVPSAVTATTAKPRIIWRTPRILAGRGRPSQGDALDDDERRRWPAPRAASEPSSTTAMPATSSAAASPTMVSIGGAACPWRRRTWARTCGMDEQIRAPRMTQRPMASAHVAPPARAPMAATLATASDPTTSGTRCTAASAAVVPESGREEGCREEPRQPPARGGCQDERQTDGHDQAGELDDRYPGRQALTLGPRGTSRCLGLPGPPSPDQDEAERCAHEEGEQRRCRQQQSSRTGCDEQPEQSGLQGQAPAPVLRRHGHRAERRRPGLSPCRCLHSRAAQARRASATSDRLPWTSPATSRRTGIADVAQHGHRIDQRDHAAAPVSRLVDDDVAGQEEAHLRVCRQRPDGETGIAGSQDGVAAELDPELLPERGAHVDLGDDAEALRLEGVPRPRQGRLVVQVELDVEGVISSAFVMVPSIMARLAVPARCPSEDSDARPPGPACAGASGYGRPMSSSQPGRTQRIGVHER